MFRVTLFALCVLFAAASPAQSNEVTLSGLLGGEDGAPLAGRVDVNGIETRSDATGRWTARVPQADVYFLRFHAEGH